MNMPSVVLSVIAVALLNDDGFEWFADRTIARDSVKCSYQSEPSNPVAVVIAEVVPPLFGDLQPMLKTITFSGGTGMGIWIEGGPSRPDRCVQAPFEIQQAPLKLCKSNSATKPSQAEHASVPSASFEFCS